MVDDVVAVFVSFPGWILGVFYSLFAHGNLAASVGTVTAGVVVGCVISLVGRRRGWWK